MATKRRRRAQARREEFGPDHRFQLLAGFDWGRCAYTPLGREFDVAAARADWAEHRDELMAFWLQDPLAWRREHPTAGIPDYPPGGAGTRPAAWWWFEAPADARHVVGLAPINVAVQRASGVLYTRHVLVESQASFLKRHALLVPGELDRIPGEAFAPVEVHDPDQARQLEAAAKERDR